MINVYTNCKKFNVQRFIMPAFITFLVRFSLSVNVAVLGAVCTALLFFKNSDVVENAWGPDTTSREILLSVYISLFALSLIFFVLHVYEKDLALIEHMIYMLLLIQVLYKICTPFTAGIANPVVISNLVISSIHLTTLICISRHFIYYSVSHIHSSK